MHTIIFVLYLDMFVLLHQVLTERNMRARDEDHEETSVKQLLEIDKNTIGYFFGDGVVGAGDSVLI